MKKERNTSLDIIRIIALFCVISIHFFWHNGFYSQTVVGKKMWVMFLIRTASTVCVPLFLVLSGYLMRYKKISSHYYKGLIKTLITYVISSFVCILFKWFYFGETLSPKQILFSILNFSGANYSWYVEMYVGLFLIIPFLNIIYNSLETKKLKRKLIITFFFLTSIPSVVNVYNYDMGLQWWKTPVISGVYAQILPDWWTGLYPITYYFLGCYLSEFQPNIKMKKSHLFLTLIGSIVVFGSYNYWRSYGGIYVFGPWEDWGAFSNIIMTVLLFCLVLTFNTGKVPEKLRVFLGSISELCFGAYLLSFIFDSIFYPMLNRRVMDMTSRLYYYIIIVPIVFLCSLGFSFLVNWVCSRIIMVLDFVRDCRGYK